MFHKVFHKVRDVAFDGCKLTPFLSHRNHRNAQNFAEYFIAEENTERVDTQNVQMPSTSSGTDDIGFGRKNDT